MNGGWGGAQILCFEGMVSLFVDRCGYRVSDSLDGTSHERESTMSTRSWKATHLDGVGYEVN